MAQGLSAVSVTASVHMGRNNDNPRPRRWNYIMRLPAYTRSHHRPSWLPNNLQQGQLRRIDALGKQKLANPKQYCHKTT